MSNKSLKAVVLADSMFGNTEKVARSIMQGLDRYEAEYIRVKEANLEQFANIDLLVVGSPTHGGRASEPTQELLNTLPNEVLKQLKVACFDTSIPIEGQKGFVKWLIRTIGYAAPKLARWFKAKGSQVLASETFFVLGKEGPIKEGELDRATAWGKEIADIALQ